MTTGNFSVILADTYNGLRVGVAHLGQPIDVLTTGEAHDLAQALLSVRTEILYGPRGTETS